MAELGAVARSPLPGLAELAVAEELAEPVMYGGSPYRGVPDIRFLSEPQVLLGPGALTVDLVMAAGVVAAQVDLAVIPQSP